MVKLVNTLVLGTSAERLGSSSLPLDTERDKYMKELIEKWKEQLKRFQANPDIAKYMNPSTAMGVQHGRTMALQECIRELEKEIDKV